MYCIGVIKTWRGSYSNKWLGKLLSIGIIFQGKKVKTSKEGKKKEEKQKKVDGNLQIGKK